MKKHIHRAAAVAFAALLPAGMSLADGAPNIHMATLASLTVDGKRSCGAVPIGADLVMTSAHCVVPEGTTDPAHPRQIEVVVTAFGGEAVAYNVADVGTPKNFRYDGIPTRDVVGRDIALLRLTGTLSAPFETVRLPAQATTHAAMRAIAEGRELPVEICETRVESGNVMALECARAPGSSGSPVFGVIDGKRAVIGVVSAGGEKGDGSPLTFATIAQPAFADITWLMQDRGAITGF